mmetsp:Transcript_29647/g.46464  ORF Transcript_29647/g.46464 Transcript_29647/m.46464 type:complete len:105 (+) Transcript_29647:416-730(+)
MNRHPSMERGKRPGTSEGDRVDPRESLRGFFEAKSGRIQSDVLFEGSDAGVRTTKEEVIDAEIHTDTNQNKVSTTESKLQKTIYHCNWKGTTNCRIGDTFTLQL